MSGSHKRLFQVTYDGDVQSKPRRASRHLWAANFLSTVSLAALLASPAQATCTGSAGNYSCTGNDSTVQSLTGTPLTVNIANGYSNINNSTNSTNGRNFNLSGAGDITLNVIGGATLDAGSSSTSINTVQTGAGDLNLSLGTSTLIGEYGIQASNNGTGSINITSAGTITAEAQTGISVKKTVNGSAGDINITTKDVSALSPANGFGINVDNKGIGAVTIVSSGQVISANDSGIRVITSGNNVDITANDVSSTGLGRGVTTVNSGSGHTSVTTNGIIQSSTQTAVWAQNTGAATTDVTVVTRGVVSGNNQGVNARNAGTGDVKVETFAAVTGVTANGIYAENTAAGSGNVTVTTNGTVAGGTTGVAVSSYGNGGVDVTTNKTVSGGSLYGINVQTAVPAVGAVNVTALDAVSSSNNAIQVDVQGRGSATVDAQGSVTSSLATGVLVTAGPQALNLDVTTKTVTGALKGVEVANSGTGSTTLTTNGTVTGNTFEAILATNSGTASDIAITTTQSATGQTQGISASNSGTGSTSITTNAAVTGLTYEAIVAKNTGTATNVSVVTLDAATGQTQGISTGNSGTGSTTITTGGTVTGKTYEGILALNSGPATDLSITSSHAISGQTRGISATNNGTGTTTIKANSTVDGLTDYGISVRTSATADGVTVTSNAQVHGGSDGINVASNGKGNIEVDARDNVISDTATGIYVSGQSQTQDINVTTAAVTAAHKGVTVINQGTGTLNLTTRGDVVAIGAPGVGAVDGIHVIGDSNVTGVTVNSTNVSGTRGIESSYAGTGLLAITTTGRVTGSTNEGILATATGAGGDISITTNSVASSGSAGVSSNNIGGGTTTYRATGATVGGNFGIDARQSGVAGLIDILVENANHVDGNAAAIVLWGNGNTLVTNRGQIGGTYNDATAGTVNSAIGIDTTHTTGTNTITNSSSISGSNNAIAGGAGRDIVSHETGIISGVIDLGAGNDSFTSGSGTITSSILMGAGDDVLNLSNTVNIASVAQLAGGSESDTLNLTNLALNGFTGADDLAKGKNLTGWETVNLNSATTLKLQGDLFSAANTGTLNVNAGSTLNAQGNSPGIFSIFGDVNNSGRITLQDGAADDVTTMTGNYNGNGGTLYLDTSLGDDSSASDKLMVSGNVTGHTSLYVSPAGGAGAATAHGILLVGVGGTSTSDAFTLANIVERGAYVYGLTYYGGADQNWYLTSKLNQFGQSTIGSIGAVYEAGSSTALDSLQSSIATLEQRVGQRQWLLKNQPDDKQVVKGFWTRAIGHYSRITPRSSDAGVEYKNRSAGVQIGAEMVPVAFGGGDLVFGLTGKYLDGHAKVRNAIGDGRVGNRSFGGGVTATWYGGNGFYLDSQAEVSRVRQRYETDNFGTLKKHVDRTAWFLSQEAGYRFAMTDTSYLVPQAQVTWGQLGSKKIHDKYDTAIHLKRATSTVGRVGLAYEYAVMPKAGETAFGSFKKAYVIGNLLHDFSKHSTVDVSGADLGERNNRSWLEAGLGGSMGWDESKTLYAEGDYRSKISGHGKSHGFKVTAGVHLKW